MNYIDKSTVREIFTLHTYLKYNKIVKIKISRDDFFNSKLPLLNNKYYRIVKSNHDLTIEIVYDKSIIADGYKLEVSEINKSVYIRSGNHRGAVYALDYLLQSTLSIGKVVNLPIMKVNDYPSFTLRGVIEGYYGLPYTPEIRLDVIDTIRKFKMNTYMYAPKFDPYHRSDWRDLYEGDLLDQLLEVYNSCKSNYVDFYYCISPGLDFDVTNAEDFIALNKKIQQMLDYGVNKFCLLLDDIDYTLNENAAQLFSNPGEAQSYMCNELNKYLQSKLEDYDLIMCPTEYYDNIDSPYKKAIKDNMDSNVKVFWTGYHTIAEVITEEESEKVKDYFGHELVLWDNYPVNDFIEDRIFVAPLTNRSINLNRSHYGMVSNPMAFWNLSKISVITMAMYMWNTEKYNEDYALDTAISESVEERYRNDLKSIIIANYRSVLSNKYSVYYDEILSSGKKAVYNYYKNLVKSIDSLCKSKNSGLLEEIEAWLDCIKAEFKIIDKTINNNYNREELLDILNDNIHIGTDLLRDYLLLFRFLSIEDYQDKVLSKGENYYARLGSRPQYWKI